MDIIKCPVKFTNDAIEFITGSEFMDIELRPKQKQIIEDLFYSFKDNGKPKYNEAVVVCGVRSGKSMISALIAAFLTHKLLAMDDPSGELGLRRGQRLTAGFVGATQGQAQLTAYAYFASVIAVNPWWVKYTTYLKEREAAGEDTLFKQSISSILFIEKNISIQALSAESNDWYGLDSYFMVFDEIARLNFEIASHVYSTLERSTKSLQPFRRVITTTTPNHVADFGMQLVYCAKDLKCGENLQKITKLRAESTKLYKETYNIELPLRSDLIAYNYSTWEMNPKEINSHGFIGGYIEDDFMFQKLSNPSMYERDYKAIPLEVEG